MELASLLEDARRAPPDRRIEWRDRIAAHGPRGIEGVRPWLSSPALAAFAIRVIERVGANGDAALATQVLRSARPDVPQHIRGDVDWALQRLRPKRESSDAIPDQGVAPPDAPIRQRSHLSSVARRRAR